MVELENEDLFDKYNRLSIPTYQYFRLLCRNTEKLFKANLTEEAKKKAGKASDTAMMMGSSTFRDNCLKELKDLCSKYDYKLVL